jgi:hypothetical protein
MAFLFLLATFAREAARVYFEMLFWMDAQSHKKLLAPPQQQLAASHNYT